MSLFKSFLKRNPSLEGIIISIKRIFVKEERFETSENYWINRYNRNGDSGPGSYNNLAAFKADTLNTFISFNKIDSLIDFGCGDGNQLSLLKVKKYLGLDVSQNALDRCKKKFKRDSSKSFLLYKNYAGEKFDLSISLDVIYHLIENETYENYMNKLFSSSKKFVIIYSSNSDVALGNSPHFKQRKFTSWVQEHITDFELIEKIPNRFPSINGSFSHNSSISDFYIYERLK